jgi:hypothetical protein
MAKLSRSASRKSASLAGLMLSELCDACFRNPVTLAQNISFLWWINLQKQQHHPQVQETISGLGDHFKKKWIPKDIKESTQDQDQGHGYTKQKLVLSYMDKSTNQWQKYPSLVTRKSYC